MSAATFIDARAGLSPRAQQLLERLRAARAPVSLGIMKRGCGPEFHELIEALDELLFAGLARLVPDAPREHAEIVAQAETVH